jgi:hypothetical protein
MLHCHLEALRALLGLGRCVKNMSEDAGQNNVVANRIQIRGSSSYNRQPADDPGYRPKVVVRQLIRIDGSSHRLRESDDGPTAWSPFSTSSKPIEIIAT